MKRLAPSTFESTVLNWTVISRDAHQEWYRFHQKALMLRHTVVVPRLAGLRPGSGSVQTITAGGLRVDWRLADDSLLILLANLSDVDAPDIARWDRGEVIWTVGEQDILSALLAAMGLSAESEVEARQTLSAIERRAARRVLPPVQVVRSKAASDKREERHRDIAIHKRPLADLCRSEPRVNEFLAANVKAFEVREDVLEGMKRLHDLLEAQGYRLAHWRVAADEVNYPGEVDEADRRYVDWAGHVCAFLRSDGARRGIVVAPLRLRGLWKNDDQPSPLGDLWEDTFLELPAEADAERYRNLFTGEVLSMEHKDGAGSLRLSRILGHFPVALLMDAPASGENLAS